MPLMDNKHIRSETVTRRVVRVGQVEKWLVLRTGLQGDSPDTQQLVADAHAFLQDSGGFAGVEINEAEAPFGVAPAT
jgi:hypothetical protein